MNTFLKIMRRFLMTMGVLFVIQIIALAYLWFADPLNIKPLLTGATTKTESTGAAALDKNPALSSDQEKALESIGIDPAKLPSEIDAATESCLRSKVSAERASEIEAGATPTPLELIKAKDCF